MKSLFLIFALLSVGFTKEIRFLPCTGSYKPSAEITSVSIDPCTAASGPCQLKRGDTYQIAIKFKPTTDIKTLKTKIMGKVGLWVPFPIKNNDACTDSGLTCPIKTGSEQTYVFSLKLQTSFPAIAVKVSWELKDENDKDVVCVYIPLKLV